MSDDFPGIDAVAAQWSVLDGWFRFTVGVPGSDRVLLQERVDAPDRSWDAVGGFALSADDATTLGLSLLDAAKAATGVGPMTPTHFLEAGESR